MCVCDLIGAPAITVKTVELPLGVGVALMNSGGIPPGERPFYLPPSPHPPSQPVLSLSPVHHPAPSPACCVLACRKTTGGTLCSIRLWWGTVDRNEGPFC